MKRSFLIAAALCLFLLCLSGCTNQSEKEQESESTESGPIASGSDLESYVPKDQAPASDSDLTPYQPEAEPEPAIQESEPNVLADVTPIYEIPSGVWLAGTDAGYSNYYHFDSEEQSGSYVSLDYGLGMPFSYDGAGNDLVFLMGEEQAEQAATVEPFSDDEFTLVWENGLPETLTYVCAGSFEDFHFYTNDELCQMAEEYYALENDAVPGSSATMTNEDNTVTVQLYDNLGDHNSTSAWYVVDRFTAVATDLTSGETVDFLEELDVPVQTASVPAE